MPTPTLVINLGIERPTISRNLYGHFAERPRRRSYGGLRIWRWRAGDGPPDQRAAFINERTQPHDSQRGGQSRAPSRPCRHRAGK
ncbi:hypothetical protein ACFV2X_28535 [Streptomyces sp. NPDC059679]|uniref:hypothetical protein n=1 Tax=Streptomyces sp. NPDC059679 TaxID=3346903 RepID=UPI003698ACF3